MALVKVSFTWMGPGSDGAVLSHTCRTQSDGSHYACSWRHLKCFGEKRCLYVPWIDLCCPSSLGAQSPSMHHDLPPGHRGFISLSHSHTLSPFLLSRDPRTRSACPFCLTPLVHLSRCEQQVFRISKKPPEPTYSQVSVFTGCMTTLSVPDFTATWCDLQWWFLSSMELRCMHSLLQCGM